LSLNTFYQFTLIPKLTPRYVNKISQKDYLNAFRNTIKTVDGDFQWDFKLTLRASRKVNSFKSPTHKLVIEKKDDMDTEYILTLGKGESFSTAFSFIYST
jgi:hypothetical protein